MHVAAETEIRELVEQALVEASCAGEPIDLLRAETEIFKEIERLFEAGGYQEAALRGQLAHKEFDELWQMGWGLIPSWRTKTFNARAETITARPMFRDASV